MSKNNLTELESRLAQNVNERNKMGDELVDMVNTRNKSRIAEKEAADQFAKNRNKLLIVAAFAVCALVAFLFYKAKFGMF